MAHEGIHMNGNNDEGQAYVHGWNTYSSLKQAWEVTGSGYEQTGIAGLTRFMEENGQERAYMVSQILELSRNQEDSETHSAEWVINNETIGIRPTTWTDRLRRFVGIGGAQRGIDLYAGINPYTDQKMPESMLDDRRYALEDQMLSDKTNALLFAGSLLSGGTSGAATEATTLGGTGKNFTQYLGTVFNLDPRNIHSAADLVGTAWNYADVISLGQEYVSRGSISIDQASAYQDFKDMVMSAEKFSDIKGYSDFEDPRIFALADAAGIPMEVENHWQGDAYGQAMVANEMMNRFNFVSGLYQMGVTDPTAVNDLYYKGVPYSYTDNHGLVWWENNPGFAESNGYMTADYVNNRGYRNYQMNLDALREFNTMRSQYLTGLVDLSLKHVKEMDITYKRMMETSDYKVLSNYLWDYSGMYSYDFFQQH